MARGSATHSLFIAAILTLGLARQGRACQCGTRPPADVALAQSEFVVAGVVTTIEPLPSGPDATAHAFPDVFRVRIRVQKRWKGAATSELTLAQASTCAFSFQLGRAYLVFASTDRVSGAGVEASKCLPNKPYAKAASELALIGPPIAKP